MSGMLWLRLMGLGDSIIRVASSHEWSDSGYPTPTLDRHKEVSNDIVLKDVSEAVSELVDIKLPSKYPEVLFRRSSTHWLIVSQARAIGFVMKPRRDWTVVGPVTGKEGEEPDILGSWLFGGVKDVGFDAVPGTEVSGE